MVLLSHMLKRFVQVGRLRVIDPRGREHIFRGRPGPEVCFRLTDPTLPRRIFFNAELAVGEGYTDHTLVLEGCDLRDFFAFYSANQEALSRYPTQSLVAHLSRLLRRMQQSNPIGKAQANVAHHYDISNDFYRLFLDTDLQYSCAYFHPGEGLEEAQLAKRRHLAAKLLLQPGQRVLDIGCGWGGLAIYLAQVAEVEVVGVTLSRAQHTLAGERAAAAGVADRVRFELLDYRLLADQFDRIVSVGMFEHVGVSRYREFFRKVAGLLADDGVALLHSIGHMSPPSAASPWLRRYIFPGAYSPSLSEVLPAVEESRLWVLDLEILRSHYADTLRLWHERLLAHRDRVVAMHDERFFRMWEFYLVSCENMFRTGAQMVFQMQLAHRRDATPLTRDYLAAEETRLRAREAEGSTPPTMKRTNDAATRAGGGVNRPDRAVDRPRRGYARGRRRWGSPPIPQGCSPPKTQGGSGRTRPRTPPQRGPTARRPLPDRNELELEDQLLPRQGVVAIEGDGRVGHLEDRHLGVATLRGGELQERAGVGVEVISHPAALDHRHHLLVTLAIRLRRRNGDGLRPAGLHADHRRLEAGDHHALADGELEGLALEGGVEEGAVVEKAAVVNLYDVALFCRCHRVLLGSVATGAHGRRAG